MWVGRGTEAAEISKAVRHIKVRGGLFSTGGGTAVLNFMEKAKKWRIAGRRKTNCILKGRTNRTRKPKLLET